MKQTRESGHRILAPARTDPTAPSSPTDTNDSLNRLVDLTQYAPDPTPDDLADNLKQAEYAYGLNVDGSRHQATETVWFDSDGDGAPDPHQTTTTWTYDDLGRLTDEAIDSYLNDLDQTEHFVYDLVGNRLAQTLDKGNDGATTPDQVTTYTYDANDRLKTESLDTNNDGTTDQTTTYTYGVNNDATQETGKEVTDALGTPLGNTLHQRQPQPH